MHTHFLLCGSNLHSTQCILLKHIILSERSRSQKATCCIIAFIWCSRKSEIVQTENRWVVARSWGCGEERQRDRKGDLASVRIVVSFDCGGGYPTCIWMPDSQNCSLKWTNYTSTNLTLSKKRDNISYRRSAVQPSQAGAIRYKFIYL